MQLTKLTLLLAAVLASSMIVSARPQDNASDAADDAATATGTDDGSGAAPDTTDSAEYPLLTANDASVQTDEWYSTYFDKCVSGTMRCNRDNSTQFYVCDHESPVLFDCGFGTTCIQNGDFIICGWGETPV
ncbi:hypothetical protein H4R35_007033 [Dimargaris xerosporica]|nr:hypothetical protein H4R35_007033 [Dimargaris xerosporica]